MDVSLLLFHWICPSLFEIIVTDMNLSRLKPLSPIIKKTTMFAFQHFKTTSRFYVECHISISQCTVKWVSVRPWDLTCLWVEDLWGEVWWRRARGEVFIAVGDEGRQWVDMVGMLHHWDFIGLLTKRRTGTRTCEQKARHLKWSEHKGIHQSNYA